MWGRIPNASIQHYRDGKIFKRTDYRAQVCEGAYIELYNRVQKRKYVYLEGDFLPEKVPQKNIKRFKAMKKIAERKSKLHLKYIERKKRQY